MSQQTDFDQAINSLNNVVAKAQELIQIAEDANFDGPANIKEHIQGNDPHKKLSAPTIGLRWYVLPTADSADNGVDFRNIDAFCRGSVDVSTKRAQTTLFSTSKPDAYSTIDIFTKTENNGKPTGQRPYGSIRYRSWWYDTAQKIETVGFIKYSINASGQGQHHIGIVDDDATSLTYYFKTKGILPTKLTDLGSTSFPFKDLYVQNSPIVTSDSRYKTQIEDIPDSVIRAVKKLKFKCFKLNSAVQSKGIENARKHFGVIAQDVISAFESQGLNAFDYGVVCKDSWEDKFQDYQVIDSVAQIGADGSVIKPQIKHIEKRLILPAGQKLNVRYEELYALYCECLQKQINSLTNKSRLTVGL